MTLKLTENPNENKRLHAASSKRMLQRSASDAFHFALLLMAWNEAINLLS
jgi:hypothetical protein